MKNLLASKTFWFNLLTIALLVIQKAGEFTWIPNDIVVWILTIGNVILRLLTNTAIRGFQSESPKNHKHQ